VERRRQRQRPLSARIAALERRSEHLRQRVKDKRFDGSPSRNFDLAELAALEDAIPVMRRYRAEWQTETDALALIRDLRVLLGQATWEKTHQNQDLLEIADDFLAEVG